MTDVMVEELDDEIVFLDREPVAFDELTEAGLMLFLMRHDLMPWIED